MNDGAIIRLEDIQKSFGRVRALKGISTEVRLGEILGLLGDNGAGKTTLVKILSGVLRPDGGTMYFQGRPVRLASPNAARALGIDTVEQNLSLVNIMSISRNFFLGREPLKTIGPLRMIDKRRMEQECKRAVEEIGVRIRSPEDLVSTLSGGERQAIAIGRAFNFGCRILLLDEPLAALSIKEARKVHEMIIRLKQMGAAVLYITHNVYHIYPIADRFVLLDKGTKLAEVSKDQVTPDEIMEAIATGTAPGKSAAGGAVRR